MYDICIIGGGASGLFLSAEATRQGLKVCVLEAHNKVCKKLLATGNGKCNLSNQEISPQFYNDNFVKDSIDKFGFLECVQTFNELGLVTKIKDGRLYPYSECSSSVQNILRENQQNVDILLNAEVKEIKKDKIGFKVFFNEDYVESSNVVFATGSNATFGKNSGWLLKPFGHNMVLLKPSLCSLNVVDNSVNGLQGIRAEVDVSLFVEGKMIHKEHGEILFKQNGLSGIVIFNVSAKLARADTQKAKVVIDFAPNMNIDELTELEKNNVTLKFGFLHRTLMEKVLQRGVENIKKYEVNVVRNEDCSTAQVMNGGLDTKQFDKLTMQSKLIGGLYAIGEVLNIDGDCGGYNLHWAWASANSCLNSIKMRSK